MFDNRQSQSSSQCLYYSMVQWYIEDEIKLPVWSSTVYNKLSLYTTLELLVQNRLCLVVTLKSKFLMNEINLLVWS